MLFNMGYFVLSICGIDVEISGILAMIWRNNMRTRLRTASPIDWLVFNQISRKLSCMNALAKSFRKNVSKYSLCHVKNQRNVFIKPFKHGMMNEKLQFMQRCTISGMNEIRNKTGTNCVGSQASFTGGHI